MTDDSTPPNWALGADVGIKCPECGTAVTGLDWLMRPPPENPDTDDQSQFTNQGMDLRPCHHQLATPPWNLGPTGLRGELELKQL
jgi:hypothetical protein